MDTRIKVAALAIAGLFFLRTLPVSASEADMDQAYISLMEHMVAAANEGTQDSYRAVMADLDNNGTPELVLIQDIGSGIMLGRAMVFYWDGVQIQQAETVELNDSYEASVYCDVTTGEECFLTNVSCLEWTEPGGMIDETVLKTERLCFDGTSSWKETVSDFSQYQGQSYSPELQQAYQAMTARFQASPTARTQPLYNSVQSGYYPTKDDIVSFVNSYQYCGYQKETATGEVQALIALLGKSQAEVEATGMLSVTENSYWDNSLFFTGFNLYGSNGEIMADYNGGILHGFAWEGLIPEDGSDYTVSCVLQELDEIMTLSSFTERTASSPEERVWTGNNCQAKILDSSEEGWRMFGLYLEVGNASDGAFSIAGNDNLYSQDLDLNGTLVDEEAVAYMTQAHENYYAFSTYTSADEARTTLYDILSGMTQEDQQLQERLIGYWLTDDGRYFYFGKDNTLSGVTGASFFYLDDSVLYFTDILGSTTTVPFFFAENDATLILQLTDEGGSTVLYREAEGTSSIPTGRVYSHTTPDMNQVFGMWVDSAGHRWQFGTDYMMGSAGEYAGRRFDFSDGMLNWYSGDGTVESYRYSFDSTYDQMILSTLSAGSMINILMKIRNVAQVNNVCDRSSTVNPVGSIDELSAGKGFIYVGGWCYDPDETGISLELHVYVGGPAGVGDFYGPYYAAYYRPDIGNNYDVGYNHGISPTVETNLTGSQEVYVYAINRGQGDNTLLAYGTVTID